MHIAGRQLMLAAVLSVFAAAGAGAQGNAQPAERSCEPKRSVTADGTIVIQNSDCTVTRVPKPQVLTDPTEPTGRPAAENKHEVQAGNLLAIRPQALPESTSDPKVAAKYTQAMSGYYEYYIAGYEHRQHVFAWQLVSSEVIFVIVTVLVFSGVYFAALQFYEGRRQRERLLAATAAAADSSGIVVQAKTPVDDSPITKFSASATGIEVSSPVLGVIILVISLAFFYLYLVYVYPITELF